MFLLGCGGWGVITCLPFSHTNSVSLFGKCFYKRNKPREPRDTRQEGSASVVAGCQEAKRETIL